MYTLPNKSTIVFHESFHDVTNIDLPIPSYDYTVHVIIKLAKHRVRSLVGFVYDFVEYHVVPQKILRG